MRQTGCLWVFSFQIMKGNAREKVTGPEVLMVKLTDFEKKSFTVF